MTVTICTWSPERPKLAVHDWAWGKRSLEFLRVFLALVKIGAVWMAHGEGVLYSRQRCSEGRDKREQTAKEAKGCWPQALHTSISD